MSWYPLGRPVGTTIYPGMQLTSVALYHVLRRVGWPMSLNDVCVFVPCWFGVTATLFLGALTAECSGSRTAGAFAALVMSIVPAHIMRSVGGGYDNESIAVTALCATFYFWCRSLRGPDSWPWGIATGLAYINMVAAWGGFTFVLNMIVFHAFVLVLLGRFDAKLHRAYSLFYVIGTAGALQIPVIGWSPFKHMEQLAGLFAFLGLQLLAVSASVARRRELDRTQALALAARHVAVAGALAAAALSVLIPMGYFAPLTTRVSSLFVKHTRTGNPLVDSVAEHQPATADAYWAHLHYVCYAAPAGLFILLALRRTDSALFIALYGIISYYFANKMNRLIILLGPASSALAGVALGAVWDWIVAQGVEQLLPASMTGGGAAAAAPATPVAPATPSKSAPAAPTPAAAAAGGPPPTPVMKRSKGGKGGPERKGGAVPARSGVESELRAAVLAPLRELYSNPLTKALRLLLAGGLLIVSPSYTREFWSYCFMFAERQSHPSVVFKARLNTGELITVTDYMDGYNWLRTQTKADARVLSWWDYGYQITGIGNRTTLADGNTWSLEHISLIGKVLTSSEEKAHRVIRHLADYVLIWAGGGGDDLAKSPHMARISASVFPNLCPGDPLCRNFGFYEQGGQHVPTPRMAASLLYKLSQHGMSPGQSANEALFKEVYTSKYGKLRIFQVQNVSMASKRWAADPKNRICDRPGSWYCVGQYPPGMPSKPPKTFTPISVREGTYAPE